MHASLQGQIFCILALDSLAYRQYSFEILLVDALRLGTTFGKNSVKLLSLY